MRFAAVWAGDGISIPYQLLEFGSTIVTDIFVNGHFGGSRRRVFIILAHLYPEEKSCGLVSISAEKHLKDVGGFVDVTSTSCRLVLGLIAGNELNAAAFAHPALNRQPLEVHLPVRSSLAMMFGRVMPFWMAGSTSLNLLVLLPFDHLNSAAWCLAAIALAIQGLAVLLSLIGPVPINNRSPHCSMGETQRQDKRRTVANCEGCEL
jgi:hypothetical protein